MYQASLVVCECKLNAFPFTKRGLSFTFPTCETSYCTFFSKWK